MALHDPAMVKSIEENLNIRYEFIEKSTRESFIKVKNKNLGFRLLTLKEYTDKQNENRNKKAKPKPEESYEGAAEKKQIEVSRGLAATSIIATIAIEPNVDTITSTTLEYGRQHMNIKTEEYLSKTSQFRKLIEEFEVNNGVENVKYYRVRDEYKIKFIEHIESLYNACGYAMHLQIKNFIWETIQNPIPLIAGIPGLHAEVLAMNEHLCKMVAKIGLIVYDNFLKELKGIEHVINKGPTDEQYSRIRAKMNTLLERELYVYTHKFDTPQIKPEINTPKEKAVIATRRFPACHNCFSILNRFCKLHIRTDKYF